MRCKSSYIAALDSKDMHGWLDTFAADGSYICIAAENEESGLPLALMMDDCHERLEDRVTYVTKVWAGTFEDYQTRHFVQRIACTPKGGDLYETVSNFTVFYTDSAGNTGIAGLRPLRGRDRARQRRRQAQVPPRGDGYQRRAALHRLSHLTPGRWQLPVGMTAGSPPSPARWPALSWAT